MKKIAVLTLSKSRKLFEPSCICSEYGNLSLLTVKNRRGAINKIKKDYRDSDVIISHNDPATKIRNATVRRVSGINYKTALPVIEKICRETAEKYNVKIPFGEIYIVASPYVACAITSCLIHISRIFTIISPESPLTSMYDELYFKHGAIIRHLPEFNNNIAEDSVIIKCCEEDLMCREIIPVINLSNQISRNNMTVDVRNVFVSDENIALYSDAWGGKSGLEFFEVVGEIPGINACVDINTMPDKIFLLDTGRI